MTDYSKKVCALFNFIAEFLSFFYLRSVLVSRHAGVGRVANNRVSC
jgi:hypothetical protein